MVAVARHHRMVFKLAEAAREGHMLGARNLLVFQEQHFVLEQQARTSAKTAPSRDTSPRLMLTSSAPMLQVSGSTLISFPSDASDSGCIVESSCAMSLLCE